MIILINGSFGVGKSSVAALRSRLPDSILFDPELLGTCAREVTDGIRFAEEEMDDFQDIQLWRALTIATGKALWNQHQNTMIVPMTLSNLSYLEEIKKGLREVAPLAHFCLTAPLAVVQKRLLERGTGADTWAWRKAEQCVPLFEDPCYCQQIATEERTVDEVVDIILVRLPQGTGFLNGTVRNRGL